MNALKSADSQLIGKLGIWFEILYNTNAEFDKSGNLIPNRKGIQSRRFAEANFFINGDTTVTKDPKAASSKLPANNLQEAQITMAFLNSNLSAMYNHIASIDGYKFIDSKLSAYSFIQKHAEASYNELIKHIDYKSMRSRYNIPVEKFAPEFELKNLFGGWSLYTDLWLKKDESGKLTGETYYGIPNLSDRNEMFIMTRKNIAENGVKAIDAKGGDDYIYTKSLVSGETFKAYLGAGYDTYIGGDADDWVDGGLNGDNWYTYNHIELGGGNNTYIGTAGKDTVSTIAENNAGKNNTIYLGSGSDTFFGSDANDWVDGGTGYKKEATEEEARNLNDLGTDINTIYLGGGTDTYVGGQTEDMPDGFWGNGSNIIFGGTESDKEVYRNEAGEITGWADHDQAQTENKIYFGRGNNEYYGTKGIDIVDAKTSISASVNKVFLGGGNDTYYCGSGEDIVHTGLGNDTIVDASSSDKIYLEGFKNEVTTLGGATFYLSFGTRNNITAKYGCTLSGQFSTTNINLEKDPAHEGMRYEKQGNDLFILYHGHSIYLEDYFDNDGNVITSKGLPTINGQTLYPIFPQAINEETFSYNLGEDMLGGRDNQPTSGLAPTATTESALLVQAISSFNPGSSSSTGDLSSESWKAPELYSPGTVREMTKYVA